METLLHFVIAFLLYILSSIIIFRPPFKLFKGLAKSIIESNEAATVSFTMFVICMTWPLIPVYFAMILAVYAGYKFQTWLYSLHKK